MSNDPTPSEVAKVLVEDTPPPALDPVPAAPSPAPAAPSPALADLDGDGVPGVTSWPFVALILGALIIVSSLLGGLLYFQIVTFDDLKILIGVLIGGGGAGGIHLTRKGR
jgi:hypothetical protein